ncbi:hypothetical protein GCM10027063_00450 [Promicromonospora xylanilytica]
MTRATTSAAPPRPTVRNAPARRTAPLVVLLATLLALTGTVAGQHAAAAERSQDDIWVNADGVAFQRGSESDEVAYVVRPAGARRGAQAYSRDLTRDEQNHGWTMFWEARRAYPDGYCVVWVEVEDAGSWHESEGSTACTAGQPAETSTPTPTPTATKADKPAQAPVATSEPAQEREQRPERARPRASAAAPAPSAAPTPRSAPEPTPTPTPTPTPSASPSASGTPSPSTSATSPDVALMQGMIEQQGAEPRVVSAGDDEVTTPLGWVAVLGSGALLTTGGLLLLWRRLT